MTSKIVKFIVTWSLLAFVYILTAVISRWFVLPGQTIAPVWLPVGLGLAALLLWGKNLWPGILLGALGIYVGIGVPIIEAGFAAAAETIMVILAVTFIWRSIGKDFRVRNLRDVARFLLAVLVAGLVGTILLAIGPFSGSATTFLAWWMAQVGGMVLFGPMIVTWFKPRTLPLHKLVVVDVLLVGLMVGLTGALVFGPWLPTQITISLPYLLILWIVWPAIRMNYSATAHTTTLLALIALIGTAMGYGPYAVLPPNISMWSLQLYVIVIGSIGLLLGRVIPINRWRRHELEREHADMAQREQSYFDTLEKSRADLLALLDNTDYSIFSVDRDFRLLTFNSHFAKEFEETYGFQIEIGQRTLTQLPGEIASAWRGFYERALSGKSFALDYPLVKENQVTYHKVSFHPIYQNGHVTGVTVFSRDITESQTLLNELSASEARWRALIENAPMTITMTDLEGKILAINRSFWPELNTEELIGQPIFQFLHQEHQTQTQDVIQDVIKTSQPSYFELVFSLPNGEPAWMANHIVPIVQDGEVTAVIFMAVDITPQKINEQAIRDNEERLREIIEAAPFGAHSYVLHPDGQLVFSGYNLAADRILGIDHSMMKNKTIEEAFPNLIETPIPQIYRQIASQGLRYNDEQVNYEGQQISGAFEIHAFQTAQNRMTVFFRDITERKKAEEALTRNQEALAKAQQIAHLGNYELDFKTRELKWSREVCRIWGVDLEKTPQYDWVLEHIHPDDRSLITEKVQNARRQDNSFSIDYRIQREDGSIRWLHDVAEIVKDHTGESQKLFGIVLDITDRMAAEEQIRQMNEELEQRVRERTGELEAANNQLAQSNQELESFSYSVSHDLRTPLRAIDGYAHILLEEHDQEISDDAMKWLQAIRRNTQQMGQLIDDLLSFARLGRQNLTQKPIAMKELVQQSLLAVEDELSTRQVDIILGEFPTCIGDMVLLRQVWVNLLTNALKFTRERDNARIEITGWQESEEIVYSIKDNGTGFDMQYADKLFGVFQRLHTEPKYEGTGVGLAIIERIIRRHNGRVWAEGRVGHGATFYFSIPIKPPTLTEKEIEQP